MPKLKNIIEQRAKKHRSLGGTYLFRRESLRDQLKNTEKKLRPATTTFVDLDSPLDSPRGELHVTGNRPLSVYLNKIAQIRRDNPDLKELTIIKTQTSEEARTNPGYLRQMKRYTDFWDKNEGKVVDPDEMPDWPDAIPRSKTKTIKLKSPYVEE